MSGEKITQAMRPMHDRSNGLGGGFAGYGIALSWESLEAGETRTIEGCDRYPVQEASVEGGAYYHVS